MKKLTLEAVARVRELTDAGGGLLTPAQVVEDARSPDSPLHGYFTWDTELAAAKWLIEEARELIRTVRLDIIGKTMTVKAIAYVRDPDLAGDEPGYVSTVSLRTDRERARRALQAELLRAEAALGRAYEVAEALNLSREVEGVLAGIRNIRQAS
jgi:hypothetical protein